MPFIVNFPQPVRPYPTAGQSLGMGLEAVPGIATKGIFDLLHSTLGASADTDQKKSLLEMQHAQNMERDEAQGAQQIQRDTTGNYTGGARDKELLMEQGRQQGLAAEGGLNAQLALMAAKPKAGVNWRAESLKWADRASKEPASSALKGTYAARSAYAAKMARYPSDAGTPQQTTGEDKRDIAKTLADSRVKAAEVNAGAKGGNDQKAEMQLYADVYKSEADKQREAIKGKMGAMGDETVLGEAEKEIKKSAHKAALRAVEEMRARRGGLGGQAAPAVPAPSTPQVAPAVEAQAPADGGVEMTDDEKKAADWYGG